MNTTYKSQMYKALTTAGSLGATLLINKTLDKGWRKVMRDDPPSEEGEEVNWGQVIMWTIITGLLVSLVKLATRRIAYLGWLKGLGDDPVKYKA